MTRAPFAIAALLLTLASVAGCGGKEPASTPAADSTTTAADSSGCAQVDAPKPRDGRDATQSTEKLDPAQTNTITFATSCGDFTVTLDVKGAPTTTASIAGLAQSGFYDNTVFHRIVPGFVVQGGDPTGTGSGGPGYQTVDEPPSSAKYTNGVVAMAKAANEPAGTSGSQFFVVTAADAGLPPDYAIVGTVTKGMDTVERIESLGTASEQPKRPVVLTKATFSAK